MSDPFGGLVQALVARGVRFAAIGVWAANYYATEVGELFRTYDQDLFLPLDPANLLQAWQVCDEAGLELRAGRDPLDQPRDLALARRVVELRALTTARDATALHVDLTLTMTGYEFEDVWAERRTFVVDGVDIPVARLEHIVRSKALAGRPKDRLFLETHAEALRDLLGPPPPS
jgi:hypothetical protein